MNSTKPITAKAIAEAFTRAGHYVRRAGLNGYRTRCPVHGGSNPQSLSIAEKDGRLLIKCFSADCSPVAILKAVNFDPTLVYGGPPQPKQVKRRRTKNVDWDAVVYRSLGEIRPTGYPLFANLIGVHPDSLRRLRMGSIHSECPCWWSFPMLGADFRYCGVHLRSARGLKRCIKHSKTGLFVPIEFNSSAPFLVAEGVSDAAALLSLGFNAIGRSSCTGAAEMVQAVVERHQPKHIVIVSDADEPGRQGATSLAQKLLRLCTTVRVIEPPSGASDMRAWYLAHATKDDVRRRIAVTRPMGEVQHA